MFHFDNTGYSSRMDHVTIGSIYLDIDFLFEYTMEEQVYWLASQQSDDWRIEYTNDADYTTSLIGMFS